MPDELGIIEEIAPGPVATSIPVTIAPEMAATVIKRPVMTREELLGEVQKCCSCLAMMKPPRGKEITIGQQRAFNCRLDLMKTRLYALQTAWGPCREINLTEMEREMSDIREFMEKAKRYDR